MELLFHFLVVAAALLGLPTSYENLHGFEDSVHPPHLSVHEVFVMDLQKPVVFLVFLQQPMASVHCLLLPEQLLPRLGCFLESGQLMLLMGRRRAGVAEFMGALAWSEQEGG